ncbi:MAG: hypothetical protein H6799_01750 [Candidatus Nomurabacteria bacterium]|nr:MAG: hypothetical protein H6799_01750 [Candidatus Nomurabacteria bacterium]HRV75909.1 hypothetical protein [Candidatus Saccharimonadales bacterium]
MFSDVTAQVIGGVLVLVIAFIAKSFSSYLKRNRRENLINTIDLHAESRSELGAGVVAIDFHNNTSKTYVLIEAWLSGHKLPISKTSIKPMDTSYQSVNMGNYSFESPDIKFSFKVKNGSRLYQIRQKCKSYPNIDNTSFFLASIDPEIEGVKLVRPN